MIPQYIGVGYTYNCGKNSMIMSDSNNRYIIIKNISFKKDLIIYVGS